MTSGIPAHSSQINDLLSRGRTIGLAYLKFLNLALTQRCLSIYTSGLELATPDYEPPSLPIGHNLPFFIALYL